jgi:uncharacterized membrane protein SpoIIM required for sporulation
MNFWQYILQPTGPSLGPAAMLAIIASMFGVIGGIALVVLPQEFANRSAKPTSKQSGKGCKEIGPKERELRAELRVKIGTGIAVWCAALIFSLLLRLLGTPGLETRLLSAFVIFALPLLVGYFIVYRLFFYPSYLKEYRRIDTQKLYEPVTKKSKKTVDQSALEPKIRLMPGKALIGIVVGPILYYVVMTGFSIPPGVSVQNHDHLLHQLGMPVIALLGYLVGLAVSLGEEMRSRLALLKPARKVIRKG